MQLQRIAAVALVLLGAVLLIKWVAATWFILLIVAALFALGAGSGMIGRWGYGIAALCVLVAVPGLAFNFLFKSVALALRLLKMAPFLLIVIGIYMYMTSAKRRR